MNSVEEFQLAPQDYVRFLEGEERKFDYFTEQRWRNFIDSDSVSGAYRLRQAFHQEVEKAKTEIQRGNLTEAESSLLKSSQLWNSYFLQSQKASDDTISYWLKGFATSLSGAVLSFFCLNGSFSSFSQRGELFPISIRTFLKSPVKSFLKSSSAQISLLAAGVAVLALGAVYFQRNTFLENLSPPDSNKILQNGNFYSVLRDHPVSLSMAVLHNKVLENGFEILQNSSPLSRSGPFFIFDGLLSKFEEKPLQSIFKEIAQQKLFLEELWQQKMNSYRVALQASNSEEEKRKIFSGLLLKDLGAYAAGQNDYISTLEGNRSNCLIRSLWSLSAAIEVFPLGNDWRFGVMHPPSHLEPVAFNFRTGEIYSLLTGIKIKKEDEAPIYDFKLFIAARLRAEGLIQENTDEKFLIRDVSRWQKVKLFFQGIVNKGINLIIKKTPYRFADFDLNLNAPKFAYNEVPDSKFNRKNISQNNPSFVITSNQKEEFEKANGVTLFKHTYLNEALKYKAFGYFQRSEKREGSKIFFSEIEDKKVYDQISPLKTQEFLFSIAKPRFKEFIETSSEIGQVFHFFEDYRFIKSIQSKEDLEILLNTIRWLDEMDQAKLGATLFSYQNYKRLKKKLIEDVADHPRKFIKFFDSLNYEQRDFFFCVASISMNRKLAEFMLDFEKVKIGPSIQNRTEIQMIFSPGKDQADQKNGHQGETLLKPQKSESEETTDFQTLIVSPELMIDYILLSQVIHTTHKDEPEKVISRWEKKMSEVFLKKIHLAHYHNLFTLLLFYNAYQNNRFDLFNEGEADLIEVELYRKSYKVRRDIAPILLEMDKEYQKNLQHK